MENNIERLSLIIQEPGIEQDDELKEKIRMIVNDLIENDFKGLVQFLYRVDVNENKLRKLLHDNPGKDAALLITDLLIDRQLEKGKLKDSFKNQGDVPDEEKW